MKTLEDFATTKYNLLLSELKDKEKNVTKSSTIAATVAGGSY
tara:strand:- start:3342 stop:3467 length:126 start_codon:yes stop_codon:yes gene_type:complete